MGCHTALSICRPARSVPCEALARAKGDKAPGQIFAFLKRIKNIYKEAKPQGARWRSLRQSRGPNRGRVLGNFGTAIDQRLASAFRRDTRRLRLRDLTHGFARPAPMKGAFSQLFHIVPVRHRPATLRLCFENRLLAELSSSQKYYFDIEELFKKKSYNLIFYLPYFLLQVVQTT